MYIEIEFSAQTIDQQNIVKFCLSISYTVYSKLLGDIRLRHSFNYIYYVALTIRVNHNEQSTILKILVKGYWVPLYQWGNNVSYSIYV